nr:hypothetical protein BaRGS_014680 [Batillaria attramentaria]
MLAMFPASSCFEWTPSSIQDGTSVLACLGENVSLPWGYVTAADETVVHAEWHKISGNEETILATQVMGQLFKFPAVNMTVRFLPNAGIQISNYTWADYATYRVTVKYTHNNVFKSASRSVVLVSPDAPAITGSRLEARMQQKLVTDVITGDKHVQLECGTFLSLGHDRPVSVVWRTPSGDVRSSTSFSKGKFHFTLPNPVVGGTYICRLDDPSTAGRCIQNVASLTRGAYVQVDEVQTRLMLLEESIKETIRNEELWERAGQEPLAKQILRRKWGWIGHTLGKPASSTTRQALTWNPQGMKGDNVSYAELDRQDQAKSNLTSDITRFQDTISSLQTVDEKLASDVSHLQDQVTLGTADAKLKADVSQMEKELSRHENVQDDLMSNLTQLEEELSLLKTADAKLTTDLADLKEQLTQQAGQNQKHASDLRNLLSSATLQEKAQQTLISDVSKLQENLGNTSAQLAAELTDIQEEMSRQQQLYEGRHSSDRRLAEQLQNDVSKLRSELDLQRVRNEELREKQEELQSSVSDMNTQLGILKKAEEGRAAEFQGFRETQAEIQASLSKISQFLSRSHSHAVKVGDRVVRGKDWKWANQAHMRQHLAKWLSKQTNLNSKC